MKCLLIANNFFMEQLGLMQISSIFKRAGIEVDMVNINEDYAKRTVAFKPDIIGYSIITGSQREFLKINSELKKIHKFISVAGGPHPTFFPDIAGDRDLDYVIRGEAEASIPSFIKFIKGEMSIPEVPNLSYKKNGKIAHNPLAPLVADLDAIPFPDRDIFFKYKFIRNGPIKHFMATRGCPFQCAYCFNEKYFELYKNLGQRVRYRSVDNLLSEIDSVAALSPIKVVYFQDDTFTLNKNWLVEFSRKYKDRINLPMHCHVRANTLDAEKIKLLKEANCISVHIAAESGDDRLRNNVLKRRMDKKDIIDAMEMLRKHGLRTMLQSMLGLPGGNFDSDVETLKLNIRCRPTYAWVSIYQPYPGTPLAEYAEKNGFFNGDYQAIKNNFFDSTPLNFSSFDKRRIENLQKIFALVVKFPLLYHLRFYALIIALPRIWPVRTILGGIYKKLRRRSDFLLYGLKLKYE